MTPRNPEESSDMDLQNGALQDAHETINDTTHAAPVSAVRSTLPPASRPDEADDAKAARDRVEAYLKGPTVFSA